MPLTAHPHPPPRPRAHPHRIFLRPRRHPRPHPTLVADSLTFTSTPALAPARSSSPHSTARADVGCSARVWARLVCSATPLCRVPIGRGCSAREGVTWSAGLLHSAALLAALLWSTSGPKVSAGACAGGSRLTPGGVQAIPRARLPLGVRCGPRHHRSPAAPPSRGVV